MIGVIPGWKPDGKSLPFQSCSFARVPPQPVALCRPRTRHELRAGQQQRGHPLLGTHSQEKPPAHSKGCSVIPPPITACLHGLGAGIPRGDIPCRWGTVAFGLRIVGLRIDEVLLCTRSLVARNRFLPKAFLASKLTCADCNRESQDSLNTLILLLALHPKTKLSGGRQHCSSRFAVRKGFGQS